MKNISLFSSSIVVMLIVFIANPVYAYMTVIVSGDSNITNPMFGTQGSSYDPGNEQFFSNVLGAGTSVAVFEGITNWNFDEEINTYYNSLSGVSSSLHSGTVTAAQLTGVDLLVSVLPDDNFTASEIAVMTGFLYGGGDIFFLGENSNFTSENARINNALTGLGSSLQIVNDIFDSGFHTATGSQIASDPYTAGVSTFTYAAPSQVPLVSGGTTLFYGTGEEPFVAYEVVPVPGAILLGILGLSVAGVKLRKFV